MSIVDKSPVSVPGRVRRRGLRFACSILGLLGAASIAPASVGAQTDNLAREVFAGSGTEEYLRTLQLTGRIPAYPWAIRSFSLAEIDRLLPDSTVHPWGARLLSSNDSGPGIRVRSIPLRLQEIYNTALPFGMNDGAVWAGKGLTTSIQGGVSAQYGRVSLVFAPILFRAENLEFELKKGFLPPGQYSVYADPIYPNYIDLPQRYGDEPYTRLDPGESTLRIDLPRVAVGVSSASQFWGPASEHPMILGNNAGGFPHLFAGTARPQNVYVGRLHGRLVWGILDQSAHSIMPDSMSRRFMTGAVAVFTPRGLPGLEIGAARFFHNIWPPDGLRAEDFLQPFESLLKSRQAITTFQPDSINDELRRSAPENQLASVFARWVLPESGFEVYGEFAREDHNYDKRDVALELTHNSGYMFGFRKAWSRSADRLFSLKAEVINARPGITSQARTIPQYPFYLHGAASQGHTQRGQILGSHAGYGGAGSVLALDYYHRRGRWTVEWNRVEAGERDRNWTDEDERGGNVLDAMHSIGVESVFFSSRYDITAGLTGAYELNRDFADDAFNLNATLGIRARM